MEKKCKIGEIIMAWDGKHPKTNEPWKKRMHERNEDTLKKFSDALVELIDDNNGEFIGHLNEILIKAGFDDTYYGDLVNDIGLVTKGLGVIVDGPPRKRRYRYINKAIENKGNLITEIETSSDEIIDQIKFIVYSRDIAIMTNDELKVTLKIIKKICNTV